MDLHVDLTPAQAWAFRALARNDEEGFQMRDAADKLLIALAEEGYNPR